MKDDLRARLGEQVREAGTCDVGFDQARGLIQLVAPPPGQIVDHHHVMPSAQQRIDEVRPDEPGAASDERSHPRAGAG